jgi:hypothetical protein
MITINYANISRSVVGYLLQTDAMKIELHGAESFFRSRRLLSYSKISEHFMESEDS